MPSCIKVRKKEKYDILNFLSSWFNENLIKCTLEILTSRKPDNIPSLNNASKQHIIFDEKFNQMYFWDFDKSKTRQDSFLK